MNAGLAGAVSWAAVPWGLEWTPNWIWQNYGLTEPFVMLALLENQIASMLGEDKAILMVSSFTDGGYPNACQTAISLFL